MSDTERVMEIAAAMQRSYEADIDFLTRRDRAQVKRIEALEAELALRAKPDVQSDVWEPVDHIMYEYPNGKSGLVYTQKDAHGRAQLRYFADATVDSPTETIIVLPDGYELGRKRTAPVEGQPVPVAVEVQPPSHVREYVAMVMEGEYSTDELRFVIYNDTTAYDWLQAAPQVDGFILFDRACGKELEMILDYMLDQDPDTEAWSTAWKVRHSLEESRQRPAAEAQPVQPVPDWSQAPEWAMYWAIDNSGSAFWHEREPKQFGNDGWYSEGRTTLARMAGKGWRETLRKRPAAEAGA